MLPFFTWPQYNSSVSTKNNTFDDSINPNGQPFIQTTRVNIDIDKKKMSIKNHD